MRIGCDLLCLIAPIEIDGLWGFYPTEDSSLVVSSVKSKIGPFLNDGYFPLLKSLN